MHTFEGKNVIITGSTRGIGEATARLMAERGASGILVTGRHTERGKRVATELEQAGTRAHFVQADLQDPDACRHIFTEAASLFGDIHCLVNAAALTSRGSIFDTSVELWDQQMAINVRAPFILTQACAHHMVKKNIAGTVVNVLSVVASGGLPFLTPYSTTKGALSTFTKNVAYALMRHRIRVNGLNLGWADTPAEHEIQKTFHGAGEDWLEKAEASLPFGRLIKPDEAARVIAFLASEESGMMTGALIDFDQSVNGAGPVSRPEPGEAGTMP